MRQDPRPLMVSAKNLFRHVGAYLLGAEVKDPNTLSPANRLSTALQAVVKCFGENGGGDNVHIADAITRLHIWFLTHHIPADLRQAVMDAHFEGVKAAIAPEATDG